jgi:para-nitrobenzyl esterase
MGNPSWSTQFENMNRRELLGGAAALVGGALAGTALQAPDALGQERPAHEGPKSGKSAPSSAPPNLDPPVVQVQGGKLRGYRDGKTTVFLGIPYAEAERFELPRPVTPWEGVKNAQVRGFVCPIVNLTKPSVDEFVFPHRYWFENEHCQVLNVWTQSLSRAAKKPVMVWMHGGGFSNGSSSETYIYDGKDLSEYGDVVVVSMNHRLNIIGTLDLSAYGPEYAQSRYTGTADLVASLQWVHDNIENFGGDPGNVTLFGQSGGGGKAARMMHTPVAKGLFHKVVCESGGGEVLADEDPAKNIETGRRIAAVTLANLNLTGDQIDKLKIVPYPDLVAAGDAALKTVAKEVGAPHLSWAVYADDKYITRAFCNWSSGIPLMFGSVFSEMMGNLESGEDKNAWTQQEVEDRLTARYGDKKDAVVTAFKEMFPHKQVRDVLFFAIPVNKALVAKREAGTAPVYNYLFTYEYPVNYGITAFHTSELAFVFHNLHEHEVRIATGDAPAGFSLQDKVSRAWIDFARTGNPSQPGLEWKPFAEADPQTMVFDIVSGCRKLNYHELRSLMPKQQGYGIFFSGA